MDRADKLINNRSPKIILLGFVTLFLLAMMTGWFMAGAMADHIMQQQIAAMLSVAGGGKFTGVPDPDAIRKGEELFCIYSVDAGMHPSLMAGYEALRMKLFAAFTAMAGILCLAGSLLSFHQVGIIYDQLEDLRKDCFDIAEQLKDRSDLYGEDFGCVRRICEGVNLISRRMQHLSASLYSERQFLREFLTDFSHQMKTSLAVVRLNNDMLAQFEHLPQEKKQLLADEITLHLDSMETLVISALKLAKLEADAISYEKKNADLFQTCHTAADRLRPLMRKKEIRMDVPDMQEMFFPHDAVWLCEAIGNLLKNAADHSGCRTIAMELQEIPGAVKLSITDDGKGIPQAEIPKLFERFGKKSNNTVMQSAGVGLAIAKQIIEAHNGEICVYSEEGKGTRFEILFLK